MTRSDTGPFALVPTWVLDADISPLAVRVYAIHADCADRQGSHYHGRKSLAARARCSLLTLDRAHAELVTVGALRIEHRRHEGRRDSTSSRYHVVRVIPNVASNLKLGGFTDEARGGFTDEAPVVLNQTQVEPLQIEPLTPVEKVKGLEALRRVRKRVEPTEESA